MEDSAWLWCKFTEIVELGEMVGILYVVEEVQNQQKFNLVNPQLLMGKVLGDEPKNTELIFY